MLTHIHKIKNFLLTLCSNWVSSLLCCGVIAFSRLNVTGRVQAAIAMRTASRGYVVSWDDLAVEGALGRFRRDLVTSFDPEIRLNRWLRLGS